MRFVHTADWQLGMTRYFLDGDAQARYSAARLDAIERIGAIAAAQDCEFVLVCGDVFESNAVSPRIIGRSLEKMAAAAVPFLLLPGNHDPLDAASVYRSPAFLRARPPNVTVLATPGVHEIRPDLQVVAAPWFSKHPGSDLVGDQLAVLQPTNGLRILAGHGALSSFSPDARNPALIDHDRLDRSLADGLIHYVALGDRHSRTGIGVAQRIWYSGTPEVTDFDEIDPGWALVVELDRERVDVNAHPVGSWHFRAVAFQLESPADVEDLADLLTRLPDKDRTVLRLELSGALAVADRCALEQLLDAARDTYAGVDGADTCSRIALRSGDQDWGDLGVGGFAAAGAAELAGVATGTDAAAVAARGALTLLYRLAGGVR